MCDILYLVANFHATNDITVHHIYEFTRDFAKGEISCLEKHQAVPVVQQRSTPSSCRSENVFT